MGQRPRAQQPSVVSAGRCGPSGLLGWCQTSPQSAGTRVLRTQGPSPRKQNSLWRTDGASPTPPRPEPGRIREATEGEGLGDSAHHPQARPQEGWGGWGRGSFCPRGHLEKILNPRTDPRVSRAITTELKRRGARLGQAPQGEGAATRGCVRREPGSLTLLQATCSPRAPDLWVGPRTGQLSQQTACPPSPRRRFGGPTDSRDRLLRPENTQERETHLVLLFRGKESW